MNDTMKFERQFFNALRDIFVGAKVEGDSGYVNLIKIKSRYYEQGVFPQLKKDIDEALHPFPDFREELFDKLYTFFQRYFSESGSIYFRYTALHQNIYEKVYTDDRDVILFWKTHMLYYVKTDRVFTSLNVEIDGVKFFFDASNMTLKKANEKRDVIYAFRHRQEGDGTLVFDVAYTERGRTTKEDEILKAVKQAGGSLTAETLNQAFRVFKKQSEVDFFINKDARAFLQEQFDLWMYQYLFKGKSIWDAGRLAQLQALKEVAFKIIEFISQFEDELVKIWNKPKFVRNSHYIITLDKLAGTPVFDRLLAHLNLPQQIQEWKDLGMLGEDFKTDMLVMRDLTGDWYTPAFKYLPLDTRYFTDLEMDILGLFDDLDASLDGWLVHSENYQALNSLLSKFNQQVQSIYIDPPYNATATEIVYENRYKHSSWATLMQDRLFLAKDFLSKEGMICITIDDYELDRLQIISDKVFGDENYLATVLIRNNPSGRSTVKGFAINHEYGLFYSRTSQFAKVGRFAHTETQKERYDNKDDDGRYFEWENLRKSSSGSRRYDRPKQFFPIYFNEPECALHIPEMVWDDTDRVWKILEEPNKNEIVILPLDEENQERVWSYGVDRVEDELDDLQVSNQNKKFEIYKKKYINEEGILARTWWEKPSYSARDNGTRELVNLFGSKSKEFEFPKALEAVQDSLIVLSANEKAVVMDFFAGSGTTAHAVMNMNRDGGSRKFILVEMGSHFNTIILPRIKKVAFCNKWKKGKPVLKKGEIGISQFVKYYDLEQYEDVLRQVQYKDSDLFNNPYEDPYHRYVFLRDLKLLHSVDVDAETNGAHFHPERLYPDIDLAETLSQRCGKWIKRITADFVEFEDGEKVSLTDPDWRLIKPLVWWQ